MIQSIRQALLIGGVAWQVVVAGALLVSGGRIPRSVLLICLLVAVLALAGSFDVLPGWVALLAVYSSLYAYYYVAVELNSPFLFAVLWLQNLWWVLPAFVLRGWASIATSAVLLPALCLAELWMHPGWAADVPRSATVTGVGMTIASLIARRSLVRYATFVEKSAADAVRARHRLAALRKAALESAEDRRILHDTVINTLGSVAAGRGAVSARDLVRERCRSDVARVESRWAQRPTHAPVLNVDKWSVRYGVQVHYSGTPPEVLVTVLPEAALQALDGAVGELVQNAAKHSGMTDVGVDAHVDEKQVTVTVHDGGVGFDGNIEPGRGLATSVLARARDAGIDASIMTAPGQGVDARLRWQRPEHAELDPPETATSLADAVEERLGWVWTAAVTAVGVLIESANHPGRLTLAYPALALVAVGAGLAWSARLWPGWARALVVVYLVLAAPACFVLAFGGVDFGQSSVIPWQAIAVTPTLILLRSNLHSRAGFWWAAAAVTTAVVVTTVVLQYHAQPAAPVVVVGAMPPLFVVTFWYVVIGVVRSLADRGQEAARAATQARAESEAEMAIARGRRELIDGGLAKALELLRSIADGSRDPHASRVQQECSAHESYLRHTTLLDARMLWLGPWVIRAFAEARARGIQLVFRGGEGVDAESADSAAALGALVLGAIAATPPGKSLSVSLYGGPKTDQLIIVGDGVREADLSHLPTGDGWSHGMQRLSEQILIEVAWPCVDAHPQ
ncbi:hypothetical protein EFY87_12710 [Flexivirga caeni]|uniref:Histidine kinase/HSP90-like ATPase domain-containing protein n=1 Tax=Flexivirga caeni TaxID=2294115 RepID=A0A3M9M6F2_9MICO|nr:hypothetical protein EFY87_12710 [Flexivirga caeni]